MKQDFEIYDRTYRHAHRHADRSTCTSTRCKVTIRLWHVRLTIYSSFGIYVQHFKQRNLPPAIRSVIFTSCNTFTSWYLVLHFNLQRPTYFFSYPMYTLTTDVHFHTALVSGVTATASKLEDKLRRPSVDVEAFATSTTCCDLDLWPPESNQVISRGQWIFPVSCIEIVQRFRETISVRTNGRRRRTDS